MIPFCIFKNVIFNLRIKVSGSIYCFQFILMGKSIFLHGSLTILYWKYGDSVICQVLYGS